MSDEKELRALREFGAYENERQARAEAEAKKWTLEEAEQLRANEPERYALFYPYIEASHARGDFRYPHEMDRKEARAHLESRGIAGEPWSSAEMRAIMRDEKLRAAYGAEVKRAQNEGRLLLGPGANKGQVFHFAGETDSGPGAQAFTKNLNAKLERLDRRNGAQTLIDETRRQLRALEVEKIDAAMRFQYGNENLKKIDRLDAADYPVRELDGYTELQRTVRELDKASGG